jgi:hypothetical protein
MTTRPIESFTVRSAGQVVVVHNDSRTAHRQLLAAAGSPEQGSIASLPMAPDVEVWLERERQDFPSGPRTLVTRGVSVDADTSVVISSAGGSGHTQWWSARENLRVCSRWRPTLQERGAALLLRSRRRALDAQVLLHYPTLWWAGVHGLTPLHAAVIDVDGIVVMLAGPGGVGKSTLLAAEIARGSVAMCDNLAVSDGTRVHGLAEPMRIEAGRSSHVPGTGAVGARTTHGRRDHAWGERPEALVPDLVVAVRRGDGDRATVRPAPSTTVARTLVAGTFAAGELRRFWPLCATLSLATGLGPEVSPVVEVARTLTERVPCLELVLGPPSDQSLRELLSGPLAELRREGAVG